MEYRREDVMVQRLRLATAASVVLIPALLALSACTGHSNHHRRVVHHHVVHHHVVHHHVVRHH
jgi:hypothetical protein